jgi:uncharacterized damage-inducible protein DinB
MSDPLSETWAIQGRIVLFLLDSVSAEALADSLGGKGRTVADHFAHVHNVRLMWLKSAAPERLEGLAKLEKVGADEAGKALLHESLVASAAAIEGVVDQAVVSGGRVKGFKPHATAFVGYLIAHESYHAGKIDLLLRQAGHAVSDTVHYGLWEWGVR